MDSPARLCLVTRGAAQTRAVGRALAAALAPGDTVFLVGELGAGKTELAKGIAEGLGVDGEREVTSPTFTLVHRHRGRLTLHHIDLYRLEDPAELADIGVSEILGGEGVAVVEWPDRFPGALGEPTATVRLAIGDKESVRELRVEWSGALPASLRESLRPWHKA